MRKHRRNQSSLTQFFLDRLPPLSAPEPLSPTVVNEPATARRTTTAVPPLPEISQFKLTNILSHVPETKQFEQSLDQLISLYRSELSDELENAAAEQDRITNDLQDASKLAYAVSVSTQAKTKQLVKVIHKLHRTQQVASAAELAYSRVHKIMARLQHLDQVLPAADRLGSQYSPHRHHYPRLHKLLINRKKLPVEARPAMKLKTVAPSQAIDMSVLPITESESISVVSHSSTRTFGFHSLVRTFSSPSIETAGDRLRRIASKR